MLVRITRRRFLETGVGIGALAVTARLSAIQDSPDWTRPGGRVPPGEWWAGGGPRDAAPACTIVRPEEPGERLILSGTVYVRDGRIPLSGVTVYVYQTDVHGLYNPEGKFGVPHRIRGWANTDVNGHYEFHTIKPGYYPNRTTPAHIHVTISRDDMPEWWLPEVRFEGDPLLTPADSQISSAAGRFGNIRPLVTHAGTLYCTRDVRL